MKLLALHTTADQLPAIPGGRIVAFRVPEAGSTLTNPELPTRLKLLNWGENKTVKGPVKVGEQTLASLAALHAQANFDRIALDYNHNSLKGHPNYQPDPRKVAAYGVPVIIPGDGIYLDSIEYTPSGLEHAREYRDISPAPLLDAHGEVVFMHSVALCPQGAVEGLSFYDAPLPSSQSANPTTPQKANMLDLKKLLLTLLGLPEDATDEAISTAATTTAGIIDAGKKAVEAGGDKDKEKTAADVTALSANVDALTKGLEAQTKETILLSARLEGKVVPLSAKELSTDQLRKIVADLPAGQIPLEGRKDLHQEAHSTDAPTPLQLQICSNLGVTWEQFKARA